MTTLNGVEFTRTGNPQVDLQTYATARGISEAEAKKELEAEFGVAEAVKNSKDEDVSISKDAVDSTDTSEMSSEEFLKGFIAKLLSLLGINVPEAKSEEEDKSYETKTINGVEFKQTGDPQEDLKAYADARGISKEEAKKELEAEFGKPKTTEKTSTSSSDETEETDDTEETSSSTSTSSTDDDDDDSTTTSSSSSSTTDTSSSKAEDRKNLQNEIKEWNAKLKQATDAGDSRGISKAQAVLKELQTKARYWDTNK